MCASVHADLAPSQVHMLLGGYAHSTSVVRMKNVLSHLIKQNKLELSLIFCENL